MTASEYLFNVALLAFVNHLLAKTGCCDRAALVAPAYRTGRAPDR